MLIPAAVMIGVVSGVLGQWLIRKKAFGVTARYSVLTAFLVSGGKFVFGLLHPTALVLIVTNMLGGLIGAGLTFLGWRRVRVSSTEAQVSAEPVVTALDMAKAHRDFPLWRTPRNLIDSVSQGLPTLLLAVFFGASAAGHYGISIAVLGVPAGLIGMSMMSVFYPRINEAIHHGENAQSLIVRATVSMSAAGGLPFVVVMLAGPMLFSFVFGSDWRQSGVYAQLLAPWLFLQLVSKPTVAAIPALRLQRGFLVYELFNTGSKLLALWVGFRLLGSDVAAIAMFSLVGVAAYLWLIFWVVKRSSTVSVTKIRNVDETSRQIPQN